MQSLKPTDQYVTIRAVSNRGTIAKVQSISNLCVHISSLSAIAVGSEIQQPEYLAEYEYTIPPE